jgi:gliding motility-associated-like protein
VSNGTYNKITLLGNSALRYIKETDSLILANNASYIYSFTDTVKINEFASLSGTPCYMIYLQSGSETTPAIFDIKAAAANLPNDTLWIDNVYVHGIKALNGANNAKLKKGNQSPDVDVAGSSWGYGLGLGNYNTGWAAMLPYQSGRTPNWDHDFYIPCLAFDIMLNSNGMLATYGATYEWRRDSLNSPIIASTPEYHALDSATYFLTMNYGNGCTATDNVSVIVTSSWIDTTLITAAICRGSTYTQNGFNESTPGIYYQNLQGQFGCDSIVVLTLSYTLLTDTINATICLGETYNDNGFNLTPTATGLTTNHLSLTTINGCDSMVMLILTVLDVQVQIVPSMLNFCEDSLVTLTAVSPQNKYQWSTGDQNQSIVISEPGIYGVTVSEGNCTASDFYTVEQCPILIVFPNAITPSIADGINDYFYLPNTTDVIEFSIYIHDRWGQLVFSSHDKHFQWDGKYKGELVQGVYAYTAFIITTDRQELRMSGAITVL